MQSNNTVLEIIYERNEFYKKKFHFALGLVALCVAGIIFLSSMLIYLIKHPPHPLYFVANPVGQLIADPSVKDPNIPQDQLTNWIIEALQSAYSYSFINYRSDLQNAQKYFTDYGWRNYMKALTVSRSLDGVIARKQILITRVAGPLRLIGEGIVGGAHAWKYNVPMVATYWEPPYDQPAFTNALSVNVLVQRQNLLTSYKGLGIVQIIAQIATSMPTNQNLTMPSG